MKGIRRRTDIEDRNQDEDHHGQSTDCGNHVRMLPHGAPRKR